KVTGEDLTPPVLELVREVLGEPGPILSGHDFIEDLGGTSLSLVTLLTRIEDEFAVRIEVTDALDDTTIAGISRLVQRATGTGSHPAEPEPTGSALDRPLFLINPYVGAALRHRRLVRYLRTSSRVAAVDVF